ncbi:hypothetical protein BpHYR1_006468, partial [Brachionus plicatilis]
MNFETSMEILEVCSKISLENVFNERFDNFLTFVSNSELLCAVSHLMGLSSICALKTLEEGCVVYTALIANASTGKSSALKLIKRSLLSVENFLKILPINSRLLNAATVEGLLFYLNKLQFVLSLWDESSTFLNSFGLYKGQGSLRHPPTFIDLIKNEVNQKDDGLIQRFHLCAPKPSFLNANEIIDAEKPECSLDVLFYIIFKLNEIGTEYILSKEATIEFNQIYSDFKSLIQKEYKKDGFI